MIHLGRLEDGRLVIASNHEIPVDVERVLFFRDQRLFVFEYEDGSDEVQPNQVSEDIAWQISNAQEELVFAVKIPGGEEYGYLTKLVVLP